ncbi:Retinoschisin, partial [Intoshia linei]
MMCVVIVLSFYLILLQYFYAFELTQVNEKNVKIDFNSLCSYSIPVGISNYYIPDQNLEATSFFNKARKAQYGRLNSFRAGGSWTAGVSNINQHLTIDLGYQYAINKISTQGRQGSNEFVTEYFVEYSIDKNIWYSYKNQYGSNQLFIGNFDDSSVVENELGNPLIAQYVRINPQRWNNMISIRIELYGCRYSKPLELMNTYIPDFKNLIKNTNIYLNILEGNKAYFNGNGYITYNLMKPENYYSSLTNNIQIRFKTTFINGILFMTDSSLGDYILIHLHHATLYVDINL